MKINPLSKFCVISILTWVCGAAWAEDQKDAPPPLPAGQGQVTLSFSDHSLQVSYLFHGRDLSPGNQTLDQKALVTKVQSSLKIDEKHHCNPKGGTSQWVHEQISGNFELNCKSLPENVEVTLFDDKASLKKVKASYTKGIRQGIYYLSKDHTSMKF